MIYYTADLHFGSAAQAERRDHTFSSVEEMDRVLIRNWNETVSPDDTVYLVGDISDHGLPFPDKYLSELNGRKHLIRGNHDTGFEDQERLFRYFETVTDFLEIDDGSFHITLCHYPIVYVQTGYMVHGHIHNPSNSRANIFDILKSLSKVMNAGVDTNHYRPVTFEELIQNNAEYYGDISRGDPSQPRKSPFAGMRHWKAEFRPLPVKGQTGYVSEQGEDTEKTEE